MAYAAKKSVVFQFDEKNIIVYCIIADDIVLNNRIICNYSTILDIGL